MSWGGWLIGGIGVWVGLALWLSYVFSRMMSPEAAAADASPAPAVSDTKPQMTGSDVVVQSVGEADLLGSPQLDGRPQPNSDRREGAHSSGPSAKQNETISAA